MQVLLLAAGRSSRMNPISDKNLLNFCGKPLIVHQVKMLQDAGLKNIVVVTNPSNSTEIQAALQSFSTLQFTEQVNLEEGQAGGVLAGASLIQDPEVLIMSTNDVFEPQLFKDILTQAQKPGLQGVIAGKQMDHYFPGGYLKLDSENCITDIIEKPGAGNEPSDLVNLICHVYKDFPSFVHYLQNAQSQKDDRYEVALDRYIKEGKAKILAHAYDGYWQAIKYPWHILEVMNRFLEGQTSFIDPTAEVAPTALIEGNVVIEKNVQILHHAMIKGPAYIGEGTIIANNSLVRGSMIGKNSVVGFNTEVTRSYLNHEVWMHSNYIGDSIIDSNVSFGAGTVLGNLRFDEAPIKVNVKQERVDSGKNKLGAIIGSGCRFGINSSTNPGVKIGVESFIGGGVLVEKDVDSQQMVLLAQELKITPNSVHISMTERGEMKKNIRP